MLNKNDKIVVISPFKKYIIWGKKLLSIPSPITLFIMVIRLTYYNIILWEFIIYLIFPITGFFLFFYGLIRNRRYIKKKENPPKTI